MVKGRRSKCGFRCGFRLRLLLGLGLLLDLFVRTVAGESRYDRGKALACTSLLFLFFPRDVFCNRTGERPTGGSGW